VISYSVVCTYTLLKQLMDLERDTAAVGEVII
jgi:hypothetical protein